MKTTELSKSESLAAADHHSARGWFAALALLLVCASARGQVNSGSTGADGAFNPTTNTVVDMRDHPTGIYHYTTVNIPTNVTVTFIPNANNTPVVWLVRSNCVITGMVDISGRDSTGGAGALGGPGGYRGGSSGNLVASAGDGPGGGVASGGASSGPGGNASYATLGYTNYSGVLPGSLYGNVFLIPLLGGSGGGGASNAGDNTGGGGGGGAILIAASGSITLNGNIRARPGVGCNSAGR